MMKRWLKLLPCFRSYHDGEHYNSVRSKEDACGGPAKPVVIEVFYVELLSGWVCLWCR